MLPIAPEPLESLRSRYAAAVATTIDVVAIEDGRARLPGELREHVFDFEDGTRLIVSREPYEPGNDAVHFSASVDLLTVKSVGSEFLSAAVARFREVSGWTGPVHFAGISDVKRVPHWFVLASEAAQ